MKLTTMHISILLIFTLEQVGYILEKSSAKHQLNQLSMPNGYPSLADISNIRTAIDLQVTQLHSPLDSLCLNAQIKSLSLRHDKYGRMQIIGNVSGMPCQAEIEGVLESEMGKASVSANIQKLQSEFASQNNAFAIDVHGITNDFDLARVLPARYQLGHTALDINVKAELSDNQLDKLAWDGAIKRLDWKGHTYRDILLDGKNQGKRWMGNIELYDTLADVNAAYQIMKKAGYGMGTPKMHEKVTRMNVA